MPFQANRRDVLKLMGVGGVVFASGLAGAAGKKKKSDADSDFFFLQLSDTHWGYSGVSNPEADVTAPKLWQLTPGVTNVITRDRHVVTDVTDLPKEVTRHDHNGTPPRQITPAEALDALFSENGETS